MSHYFSLLARYSLDLLSSILSTLTVLLGSGVSRTAARMSTDHSKLGTRDW